MGMARSGTSRSIIFFRTISYIRRIIAREHKLVQRQFNTQHDPFYGWIVGNIAEYDIKKFVIDNFDRFQKESVSTSTDKHNQLDFSLLRKAVEDCMARGGKPVFPPKPENFSLLHWKMIRERFLILKVEEGYLYFESKLPEKGVDTGLSSQQLEKLKFADERKRLALISYLQEQASERITEKSKVEFIKKQGAGSFDEIIKTKSKPDSFSGPDADSDDDSDSGPGYFEDFNIQIDAGGRDKLTIEKYIDFISSDLSELTIGLSECAKLRIVLKDKGQLLFHLAYIDNMVAPEVVLERLNSVKHEIRGYLLAKYLNVQVFIKEANVENVKYYYIEAYFALDAVKIPDSGDRYFVRNDNIDLVFS